MEKTASALTDRLTFSPVAVLSLKLAAFAVMLGDHYDWFFSTGQGIHAGLGRLVFPVFGVVFAFNMARTDWHKLLSVVAPRLALAGAAAHLPYAYLQGAPLPLNILFTLSAAAVAFGVYQRHGLAACALVVLIAGIFVDYAWFGLAGVVAVAVAFRTQPSPVVFLAMLAFSASLWLINGNLLAVLAVPLLLVASRIDMGEAPRLKWLFWLGYPLHLIALAIFKSL